MGQLNHYDYYIVRAAIARSLARRANDPQIAKIHEDFARNCMAAAAEVGPLQRERMQL